MIWVNGERSTTFVMALAAAAGEKVAWQLLDPHGKRERMWNDENSMQNKRQINIEGQFWNEQIIIAFAVDGYCHFLLREFVFSLFLYPFLPWKEDQPSQHAGDCISLSVHSIDEYTLKKWCRIVIQGYQGGDDDHFFVCSLFARQFSCNRMRAKNAAPKCALHAAIVKQRQ